MNSEDYKAITGGWDYSALPANVQVGSGCFLERKDSFKRFRSSRQPGLVLGNRVRIHTWTEFNIEAEGHAQVGDDSILVGAVLMCAREIYIGQRVIISYNVTIADSDFHPINPEQRKLDALANAPQGDRSLRPTFVSRPVVIEDDAWIGIGAVVLKGVHIGRGARVAAGAVVTSNVPPRMTAAGNPACVVEGLEVAA